MQKSMKSFYQPLGFLYLPCYKHNNVMFVTSLNAQHVKPRRRWATGAQGQNRKLRHRLTRFGQQIIGKNAAFSDESQYVLKHLDYSVRVWCK